MRADPHRSTRPTAAAAAAAPGPAAGRRAAVVAALTVGGTAAVAATGLGAGLAGLTAGHGAGVDDVALLAGGGLALGLLARWMLGAALLAAGAVVARTGRRWTAAERGARRALPRGVHALLVTGLGAGALGAAPTAHAAGPPAPAATSTVAAARPDPAGDPFTAGPQGDGSRPSAGRDDDPLAAESFDPGWTPRQPPAGPCPDADAGPDVLGTPTRTAGDVPDVVVRRGDTLWAVAARSLPVDATDAQIAVEWPRWYRANRAVVGPDPDRLLPGVRLRAPLSLP